MRSPRSSPAKHADALAAFICAILAMGALGWAQPAQAGAYDDFSLGTNAEHQACRGVWRFESAKAPTAVDIYCGAWEAPSGTVRLTAAGGDPAQALSRDCAGDAVPIPAGGDLAILQTACARGAAQDGPRRFGLVAKAGARAAYGSVFPSDWAPVVAAARVVLGLDKPGAAVASQTALTPGLKEIEAVYPDGPPGQGAAFNYELLRRRGYEKNVAWSFDASGRDFSELLRAHQKVAPDDKSGEAEILAEVALNLSDSRRFADAGDLLDRADAEARAAGDALVVTKIANYRAVDALNRGRNAEALKLALDANAERARIMAGGPVPSQGAAAITAADAHAVAARDAPRSTDAMLTALEDITPRDKAEVLNAQGCEIAAVAARLLGRDDAGRLLDEALGHLAQSQVQPAWLAGLIYEERSNLALSRGNASAADGEAKEGLRRVRELAPETRIEARLMMAAERAELAAGDRNAALAQGRAAVLILERQSEAPGMPADEAAGHVEALLAAYEQSKDPALAGEYFETLSLVWDGAASRAAAELAARLSGDQGGDAIKAYQDAQRLYRSALAKRVRISATEAPPADLAAADHDADVAGQALAKAEATVRQASPRYLELLNPEVSTPGLIKTLGPDEGYISLVLTDKGGYGALVTNAGVTPYRIALTADQAQALVTKVRQSAVIRGRRLPDFDLIGARKLYSSLFDPIATQIEPLKTLHIDGGGILAAVPMAALLASDPTDQQLRDIALEQNYAGVDWFARHHTMDIALGPASFVRTRAAHPSAPNSTVVAFGDFRPDPAVAAQRIAEVHGLSGVCEREVEKALFSLKALPDTAQEARKDAAVFGDAGRVSLGAQFTAHDFLTAPDVADAQVLVLATHGVLGLSTCFAEPALLTSVGSQGDGLIEASQLLDRSLKARLVVLSACDTAGGGGSVVSGAGLADGGEALSGLARAFIYAGSPGVLATLWKIDAAASAMQTSVLLTTAAHGGVTIAQALGAAQKALYDQAETAHPFFWSGFVLIGDGGVVLSPPGTQTAAR